MAVHQEQEKKKCPPSQFTNVIKGYNKILYLKKKITKISRPYVEKEIASHSCILA